MSARIVKNFFCMFSAVGAGAKGMKQAQVEVAGLRGSWQCLGGMDIDKHANAVFERELGVRAVTRDLMDVEQYTAFNDAPPPPGWCEATPTDVRAAAQHQHPHAVFLSAPCKGFSGLLSETKSKTAKYQALNRLTLRGVWLMLEAWADDPVEMILFENVPRLATRGRVLLDRITAMLRAYGYVTAETTHDCGELGGLAQSRKRFLLVARHLSKVPNMLYQPPRQPLRAVGEVLGKMPLAGDMRAGVMHRLPSLQWKTWVRLAFVEAGSDWRSLNRLKVEDGNLRDYLLMPTDNDAWHGNVLGVTAWDKPAGTVTSEARPTTGRFAVADPRVESTHEGSGFMGVRRWDEPTGVVACESRPSNGAFSVADPRFDSGGNNFGQYGVLRWDRPTGSVINVKAPGQGNFSVADPRCSGVKHNNCFRVVNFNHTAGTVTGGGHPSAGGQCVADPRPDWNRRGNNLVVSAWDEPSRTVIAGGKGVQGGWLSIADPRSGMDAARGAYLTGGHYGVVPWDGTSGSVAAAACHDNGRWSVADPRTCTTSQTDALPAADQKLVTRIISEDGTWHRPFTTLELAALQSMFDPEDPRQVAAFTAGFTADVSSDSMHREWIGNAVPVAAARAIGTEILRTLLLADAGETFALSAAPIWVQPVVTAISLAQGAIA